MKKYLLTSAFFLILICLVPLNIKNDLDGNLFQVLYLKQHFSLLNPNLHQGMPTMGDPINPFWYPLTSLMFFLPLTLSLRLIYIICWVFTLIFAYFLLRFLQVNKSLAAWLALTYVASSYYLARVIAGHFEKVLSYPLIPLFILAIIRLEKKTNLKNSGLLAIVFYLLFASTDMYNLFYLSAAFAIYFVFAKDKFKLSVSLVLAGLFAAVRWLPMLPVLSHLFKISDPYSGSQNPLGLFLQMVLPKAGVLKFLVPTNFGWWEKTAFIGPLFFAAVFAIKRKINSLVLILALTAVAIAMPASIFSPWHWLLLIPQFTMFHVPTRVFGILTLCVIIITAPVLARWPKWGVWLVQINLILLAAFWLFIFRFRMLPAIDPRYAALESYPHPKMASILYPAFDNPVLERDWQGDWQLFHTTHGTYLQNSPAADWTAHLVLHKPYNNTLPNYEVWPDSELAELPFPGTPVASESGVTLYKVSDKSFVAAESSPIPYYLGAMISLLSMGLWYRKNY